jgi:hypothetical protein
MILAVHVFRFLGAMSDMRDRIVEAVTSGFAPLLKAAGYRKKGLNFHQEASPTVVRLVNVQCSQWNDELEGRFTVNLGVYHRDLAALHDALPVVESPLVKDCIIQERLSVLMPAHEDQWWCVDKRTDVTALGAEVARAWSQYGQPWLDSLSSLNEARSFLLADNYFFLAALASHALGDRQETERLLERAEEDWPEGKKRIGAWRRAHLRRPR